MSPYGYDPQEASERRTREQRIAAERLKLTNLTLGEVDDALRVSIEDYLAAVVAVDAWERLEDRFARQNASPESELDHRFFFLDDRDRVAWRQAREAELERRYVMTAIREEIASDRRIREKNEANIHNAKACGWVWSGDDDEWIGRRPDAATQARMYLDTMAAMAADRLGVP